MWWPPLRVGRTYLKTFWMALLLSAIFTACGAEQAVDGMIRSATPVDLVLTGLNVVNIETGSVLSGQSIVIADGDILDIRPDNDLSRYHPRETHDHTGHFAIPGLWDMHIHLRGGPELVADNEFMLASYLAYGITGVRDAAGDLADEVSAWRDEISTGQRLGPVLFTSLRKLDGPGRSWPGSIAVSASEDILPALEQLETAGADFIKLYDRSMDPEIYLATLRAAESRGLKTSAHLPLTMPFEDALEAGLDSIEHPMYLLKAAAPDDESTIR